MILLMMLLLFPLLFRYSLPFIVKLVYQNHLGSFLTGLIANLDTHSITLKLSDGNFSSIVAGSSVLIMLGINWKGRVYGIQGSSSTGECSN